MQSVIVAEEDPARPAQLAVGDAKMEEDANTSDMMPSLEDATTSDLPPLAPKNSCI